MLTLIKGRAGKFKYIQTLHNGTNNSLMILYGYNIPVSVSDEKVCLRFERMESTKTDHNMLKEELWMLLETIINQSNYNYIYLYGNFEPSEIEVLQDIDIRIDGRVNLVATVQDSDIPKGQIVIEEVH